MPEKIQPTHEQIQQRAYEMYLARGGEHGSHEDDWFAAEQELKELEYDTVLPATASDGNSPFKAELGAEVDPARDGSAQAQLGTQTEDRSATRQKKTASAGFSSPGSSAP